MTSNTTNLGASSPLPEGGKSLRIPSSGRAFGTPLKSNVSRLMPSPGFVFPLALLTLIGSPVIGLVAANRLSVKSRRSQRYGFTGFLVGIAIVVFSGIVGIVAARYEVNALILALAYVAYGILALSTFRIRPRVLGVIVGIIASTPMVIGVLLGTVGILGVAFIVGDTIPIHEELIAPNKRCYVKSFGNATTLDGGYNVTIRNQIPILTFIEYATQQKRFTNPTFQPHEACRQAQIEGDG